MSKCRVTIEYGAKPYIIIAPHGYQGDDYNTSIISERIASILDCNVIINHGWQKSEIIDINHSKANCNNYYHMLDVVKDEFLYPVLRTAESCVRRHGECIVVWIHGISNNIRKLYNNDVDMIFGHGVGQKFNRLTCPIPMKEFVIHNLNKNGIKCYDSAPGGNYSGFSKQNMNQIWTMHNINPLVKSFQLEIIKELREDDTISFLTADYIAESLKNIKSYKSWTRPSSFTIKRI